eukprot:1136740-Rhodomonas_salina.1
MLDSLQMCACVCLAVSFATAGGRVLSVVLTIDVDSAVPMCGVCLKNAILGSTVLLILVVFLASVLRLR